MPTATLGALAAAGRILFAPIPDFKPVSAICIIAGAVFRQAQRLHSGSAGGAMLQLLFRTGTVDALADVCMGIGRIRCRRIGKQRRICVERTGLGAHGPSLGTVVLLCYGFLSGLGYGFILNSWYIVAFLVPVTWQGALAAYLAGLPLDLIHSIATVIFLSALYLPWKQKLERNHANTPCGKSSIWC